MTSRLYEGKHKQTHVNASEDAVGSTRGTATAQSRTGPAQQLDGPSSVVTPPPSRRRTALATAAAGLVLLLAAPSPAAGLSQLRDPAPADPFGPVVAGISLLAWAVALWLALTVLVTLAAARNGRTSRLSRAVATRIAPVAVRRAVELSLGLTIAVGAVGVPTAAAADPAGHPAAAAGTVMATPVGTWTLDWPTSPLPATASPSQAAPAPASPPVTSRSSGEASSGPDAPHDTGSPDPAAPPSDARPATGTGPTPGSGTSVVVRPGDSLWGVAQAHLTATGQEPTTRAVAAAWPSWWAANRERVGDDPDLLRPGTELTVPGPSR